MKVEMTLRLCLASSVLTPRYPRIPLVVDDPPRFPNLLSYVKMFQISKRDPAASAAFPFAAATVNGWNSEMQRNSDYNIVCFLHYWSIYGMVWISTLWSTSVFISFQSKTLLVSVPLLFAAMMDVIIRIQYISQTFTFSSLHLSPTDSTPSSLRSTQDISRDLDQRISASLQSDSARAILRRVHLTASRDTPSHPLLDNLWPVLDDLCHLVYFDWLKPVQRLRFCQHDVILSRNAVRLPASSSHLITFSWPLLVDSSRTSCVQDTICRFLQRTEWIAVDFSLLWSYRPLRLVHLLGHLLWRRIRLTTWICGTFS